VESRPRTTFALSAGGNPRPICPRCRLTAFPHRLWAPRCPHSPGRHLHPASRDVALRREEERSRLQTAGFPEPSSRLREEGRPSFPADLPAPCDQHFNQGVSRRGRYPR
jgi:hypothetical protein